MRLSPVILLVAAAALAQQPPATTPRLSSVEIHAELRTRLDASKANAGDAVRMKLMHALLVKGRVAIPQDATIIGHITQVERRTGPSSESCLAVRIDRAEWKGNSVPLEAVIVGHSQMVYRIVRGLEHRPGDSMEADMMAAASKQASQSASAQTNANAPAPAPAPPSQPTPPTSPTAPPSPTTKPASSTPPMQPAPAAAPRHPFSMGPIKDQVESRYARDVIIARGPRAVDLKVMLSTDPNVGSVLTCSSREVVVPKGVLLVLKQPRKP